MACMPITYLYCHSNDSNDEHEKQQSSCPRAPTLGGTHQPSESTKLLWGVGSIADTVRRGGVVEGTETSTGQLANIHHAVCSIVLGEELTVILLTDFIMCNMQS